MKKVIVTVVIALFFAWGAHAGDLGKSKSSPTVKPSTTKPVSKATKLSPNVKKILKQVKKARSLEDLSLDGTGLSEKERLSIEAELGKGKYPAKFRSLQREAKASAKSAMKQKLQKLKVKKNTKLKQAQKQQLGRLNAQAKAKIQRLKSNQNSKPNVTVRSLPTGFKSLTPGMKVQMIRPPSDIKGSIRSVSPQPVVVGEDLTILGSDFGDEKGVVKLAFEGYNAYIDCVIDHGDWYDDRIIVEISTIIETIVGPSVTRARLWVWPDGEDIGPSRLIDISPGEVRLKPFVTEVSPREIRPGQIVFISGENFMTQGSGSRVDFRFSRPPGGTTLVTHTGIIDYWDDTTIAVHVPETLGGLRIQSRLDMEIRNSAGNTGYAPICRFDANVEITVLSEELIYEESGSGIIWCDFVDFRNRNFESFAGMILQNDWKVVDCELEITDDACFGDSFCNYTLRPAAGSVRPECHIRMQSKPRRCVCVNYVTIEGPVGLPYE